MLNFLNQDLKLLDAKLLKTSNISKNTIQALNRINIFTCLDLLKYKPRKYTIKKYNPNIEDIKNKDHLILQLKIIEVVKQPYNKSIYGAKAIKRSITKVLCEYIKNNKKIILELVFFKSNSLLHITALKNNKVITIDAEINFEFNKYSTIHPELIFDNQYFEKLQQNQNNSINKQEIICPIYDLTYGLSNKALYTTIVNLFFYIKNNIEVQKKLLVYDLKRKDYLSFWVAIKNIHIPSSFEMITKANKRLELDELLAHKIVLLNAKSQNKHINKPIISKAKKLQEQVLEKLNFTLTSSQLEVLHEIEQDQFNAKKQMSRLLQGDVGSGKTLVALLSALNIVASSYKNQVAIMVPISLLANQHYIFFENALLGLNKDFNIKIALLTSHTAKIKKKKILDELLNGEINILIGTQAIIQDDVKFNNLVYAIIDEQHRFGVEQRAEILKKGAFDILMMTATPIPRTMQIIYYNEMDISIMQNKIATQKPIITSIVSSYKTEEVIENLCKSLANDQNKHKAYWICPLKTQTEDETCNEEKAINKKIKLISAQERLEILQKKINNIPIHLLTSDTKNAEKDSIISEFQKPRPQIIVATTVIEVGIDVKDATIIIIENAQQFGLSQLHQIRGRVGRGILQSYCILIFNYCRTSAKARHKLQILKDNNDGFIIADKDLALRGSGEIFGTKQSGENQFYFANFENIANSTKEYNNFYADENNNLLNVYQIYINNFKEKIQTNETIKHIKEHEFQNDNLIQFCNFAINFFIKNKILTI